MNLYRIWQNTFTGYDTFDAAIVAADTEEEARRTHPAGDLAYGWPTDVSDVQVALIGTAASDVKRGVVLASFNAG